MHHICSGKITEDIYIRVCDDEGMVEGGGEEERKAKKKTTHWNHHYSVLEWVFSSSSTNGGGLEDGENMHCSRKTSYATLTSHRITQSRGNNTIP